MDYFRKSPIASPRLGTHLLITAWFFALISIVLISIVNSAGTNIVEHDITQTSTNTGYYSNRVVLGNLQLFSFTLLDSSNYIFRLYPNALLWATDAFGEDQLPGTTIPISLKVWRGPGGNAQQDFLDNVIVFDTPGIPPVWKNNAAPFTFHILALTSMGILLIALPSLSWTGMGRTRRMPKNGHYVVLGLSAAAALFALIGAAVLTGVAVRTRHALVASVGEVVEISNIGGGIMALLWIGTILAMLLPVLVGVKVAEERKNTEYKGQGQSAFELREGLAG